MKKLVSKLIEVTKDNNIISEYSPLFDINIEKTTSGMSSFQITHFVLGKKEFPTDFAQYKQAKFELVHRINTLDDMYFQYKEAETKIKLYEGNIEKIKKEEIYPKIKEARMELEELKIEKQKLKIHNIKQEVNYKLKEAMVFYSIYKKHEKFDKMDEEEIKKYEEEMWHIKSAYYPEISSRYLLTPSGFIELPHEKEGLNRLIDLQIQEKNMIERNI